MMYLGETINMSHHMLCLGTYMMSYDPICGSRVSAGTLWRCTHGRISDHIYIYTASQITKVAISLQPSEYRWWNLVQMIDLIETRRLVYVLYFLLTWLGCYWSRYPLSYPQLTTIWVPKTGTRSQFYPSDPHIGVTPCTFFEKSWPPYVILVVDVKKHA